MKGLPSGPDNPLRRSARWTGARREAYLAVLRETGNARAAAEEAGVDRSTIRNRRRRDPAFDQACEEAVAAADARLDSGAEVGLDPFEVIRRGSNGRLRIVAVGEGRWTGLVEQRFFASLRENGNISAAARAVGFTPETVWERRRKWPAFAAAIEAVLEEAEVELEFRLAKLGNDVVPATAATAEAPPAAPFDPEFALKFLKWREEKRRGGGRRGRGDRYHRREPTIEEVRDEILRRIAAIRRHREKQARPDEDGQADSSPAPG